MTVLPGITPGVDMISVTVINNVKTAEILPVADNFGDSGVKGIKSAVMYFNDAERTFENVPMGIDGIIAFSSLLLGFL